MLDTLLPSLSAKTYLEPDEARNAVRQACASRSDVARCVEIGESEEGRPIDGVILGRGRRSASLIAGTHSDEPVGPDFLRRFALAALDHVDEMASTLERYRFHIVPHANPDGEVRNRAWRTTWPNFSAYLEHAYRERPGRDVEFGFPDMRKENAAVAGWLQDRGPFQLHGSLHGMGVGEGALLLVERHWGYRSEHLQDRFRAAVSAERLPLHDHNRKGEKGFFYLGTGLGTTPESAAMRAYFRAANDPDTAELFQDSSMEFVRRLGGDPLCYVTELPLFLVEKEPGGPPGVPSAYLALKEALPELRMRISRDESIDDVVERFGIRPLDIDVAHRLQLRTLAAALEQITF